MNVNYDPKKLLSEYQERFRRMSDVQLIDAFNCEVGCSGWTLARSLYLSALHTEFNNRGFDYACIGTKEKLSFQQKIKLSGKKIKTI